MSWPWPYMDKALNEDNRRDWTTQCVCSQTGQNINSLNKLLNFKLVTTICYRNTRKIWRSWYTHKESKHTLPGHCIRCHDNQHNDNQHNDVLPLCWVSRFIYYYDECHFYWVLPCWMPLCQVSLCWVSWRLAFTRSFDIDLNFSWRPNEHQIIFYKYSSSSKPIMNWSYACIWSHPVCKLQLAVSYFH